LSTQFHGVCSRAEYLGSLKGNKYGDTVGVLNVYLDILKHLKTSKNGKKISERNVSGQQLISRYRLKCEIPRFVATFGAWCPAQELLYPCTLAPGEAGFSAEAGVPDVAADQQRGRLNSCGTDTSADVSLDLVMQKAIDVGIAHEQELFAG
jgi:hypothetical protein